MVRYVIVMVSVVLWSSLSPASDGGKEGVQPTAAEKPAKDAGKPPVTPEMESAAMSFVQQNHPELAELIHQLRTANSPQYQQAIRDLSRAATTLANTEKNDPKKYVLDLHAWQVNSQIQVIAARLAMSPTPELRDELKQKLFEQIDVRLEQQKLERERAVTRLKRLDENIVRLEETRETEATRAFEKLTRAAVKPAPKKDAKTPPKKPDQEATGKAPGRTK